MCVAFGPLTWCFSVECDFRKNLILERLFKPTLHKLKYAILEKIPNLDETVDMKNRVLKTPQQFTYFGPIPCLVLTHFRTESLFLKNGFFTWNGAFFSKLVGVHTQRSGEKWPRVKGVIDRVFCLRNYTAS